MGWVLNDQLSAYSCLQTTIRHVSMNDQANLKQTFGSLQKEHQFKMQCISPNCSEWMNQAVLSTMSSEDGAVKASWLRHKWMSK